MAEIIPTFTSLLHKRRPIYIQGDGRNSRRYLYAADAVDAFDTILHKGTLGEIYNIGSRDEVTVLQMASLIRSELSIPDTESGQLIKHTEDRPHNDLRYAVNDAKLKNLGWSQKVNLSDGLRITVEWTRMFWRRWWSDSMDPAGRMNGFSDTTS